MKRSNRKPQTIGGILSGPKAHNWAFVLFFVVVFFTGGGSRDDIQSLVILRPMALLFCAYALTFKASGQWTGRMFPLYIAVALATLMIVQLIPLPPSIWSALPGRQLFADIANIAGIEQPWRPLTLSPSKSLNSLFSLSAPIAAMMLYLNLDRESQKRAMLVIIVLIGISALWAIFQLAGSARGPLYTYNITNFGTGVGLFANRNHQAVMLASGIAVLGWYAATVKSDTKQAVLKFYGSLASGLVFVPLIFVTGSRAGLLLMGPALIFFFAIVYFGSYHKQRGAKTNGAGGQSSKLFSGRKAILMIGILSVAGLIISMVMLSRSLAFDRLLAANDLEELRIELLPVLLTMFTDYLPWGSGFGSFEHVYKIYEPQEMLRPSYLNQAHNDWFQYSIEGGIPAILIATCAITWFFKRILVLKKHWRSSAQAKYRALTSAAVMLLLMVASAADYPLRIPSIIAIFVVLVCVFNDSVRSVQHRDTKQR